jgi:hypothetical protein
VDLYLATPGGNPLWEHQRKILLDELGERDAVAALRQLPALLEKVGRDVEGSRAKDDERGRRIIDDYAETHADASADPFVIRTWAEVRRLQAEVEQTLGRLNALASAERGTPAAVGAAAVARAIYPGCGPRLGDGLTPGTVLS